jgi:hypothetical protein
MKLPKRVKPMKNFALIPLLLLSACSTAPKVDLRPVSQPTNTTEERCTRYPETIRAYHIGRYADPHNDSIMHEQHVVYRVEDNARWDLHPGNPCGRILAPPPVSRDPASVPLPVNDAIIAEVNSQRLATAQLMGQTKVLSGALQQLQAAVQIARTNEQAAGGLRVAMDELRKRLDALESAAALNSATNPPSGALNP